MKEHYIIVQEPVNEYDHKGYYLKKSEKLSLYYMRVIGRSRIYRLSFNFPPSGAKLLTFKSERNAQKVADDTNKRFNQSFKVVKAYANSQH